MSCHNSTSNMLLGMNWILTKAFYFLTLQLTDRNKKKMFSADVTSGLSADSQGHVTDKGHLYRCIKDCTDVPNNERRRS